MERTAEQIQTNEPLDEREYELLELCRKGDTQSFRTIVERYTQYAFALSFRFVRNDEEAKDIVQEAFIRVWSNLSSYNSSNKFTTWFYRIIVNLCYDHLRSERRQRKMFQRMPDDFEIKSNEDDPSLHLENKELAEQLEQFTDSLPIKQRMVFILRDLQGLTMKEFADILKISESSVKANLYYARQEIRLKYERMEKRRN